MAHLQAEDAYTQTVMKHTAPLQEKLYNEMLSHIKQTDTQRAFSLRKLLLLHAH